MGRFIAIEGGDGSGKRTQAKLLVEHLQGQGFDVLAVSFPQYGKDSAYYVEQYLNGAYGESTSVPADLGVLPYAIDRYAASAELRAHLKKEKSIIIADRYMASNLAHQGTKVTESSSARKAFYERTKITEYEVLGIPKPDINIVLLMPSEHMQANVDKKSERSYTKLKRDIHEADSNHLDLAKARFEELCELYPKEFTAINCIDETSNMRSINSIQAEIRKLVF